MKFSIVRSFFFQSAVQSAVQLALLVVGVAIFWILPLAWGLPTRSTDAALFGSRTPWTGQEIQQLTNKIGEDSEMDRGADVAEVVLRATTGPILLNSTDPDRAKIVRRYRLMSKQPDEFITLKALAEMNARSGIQRLDPRLYQYGGLWIYPAGMIVKCATLTGYVRSPPTGTPSIEFFLDHPEEFAKFYVLLRSVSVIYGVLLLGCVWWIVFRSTRVTWLATSATMVVLSLPVVSAMATEAKPHLGGAALSILAVCFATKFIETGFHIGKRKWFVLASLSCGAAMSIVLTGALSLVLIPAMVILGTKAEKPNTRLGRRVAGRMIFQCCVGVAVALFVFVLTNPFLIYSTLFRADAAGSNLSNTAAMYRVSVTGMWQAIPLLVRATDWMPFVIASAFVVMNVIRPGSEKGQRPAVLLLLILSMAVFIPFALFASGKATEYARFAVVPAVAIAVSIFVWPADRRIRSTVAFFILALLIVFMSFIVSRWNNHVSQVQGQISTLTQDDQDIGLLYEPAPWSVPPIDLFEKRIFLLPRDSWRDASRENMRIFIPTNLASEAGLVETEHISWRFNSPVWVK